jgi:hypothetical protein
MREPALDEVRRRVKDECPDCVGECPLIARLDEEGGRARDLRQGAGARDDNGATAGHRLKRRETKTFVQRWPGEAGGARVPGGEILVGHVLREDDIVIEPERPDERKVRARKGASLPPGPPTLTSLRSLRRRSRLSAANARRIAARFLRGCSEPTKRT